MSDLTQWLEQVHHEDSHLRREAAQKLGQFPSEDAVVALQTLLADESVAVVRTAILALGTIGGCEVVEAIIKELENNNLWIRKAVVQALGEAKCQDVAPILINLLGDEELNVLAREALIRLKVDPDFF